MVTLNPENGVVDQARTFDTYASSASLDAFIQNNVTNGQIVVATSADDCVSNLSHTGKQWFQAMGSKEIGNVGYRDGFSFIG